MSGEEECQTGFHTRTLSVRVSYFKCTSFGRIEVVRGIFSKCPRRIFSLRCLKGIILRGSFWGGLTK